MPNQSNKSKRKKATKKRTRQTSKGRIDYTPAALPNNPKDDFPLTRATAGTWVKQINGKRQSFGKWGKVVKGKLTLLTDPEDPTNAGLWKDALRNLHEVAPNIIPAKFRKLAGIGVAEWDGEEVPAEPGPDISVAGAANLFLQTKHDRPEGEELSRSMLEDYERTCQMIVDFMRDKRKKELLIDIDESDLKALGEHIKSSDAAYYRRRNMMVWIRSFFKFCNDTGVLFVTIEAHGRKVKSFLPFKYVEALSIPKQKSKAVRKLGRIMKGDEREKFNDEEYIEDKKLFRPSEIKQLLENCRSSQIRAMILLGLNAGFLPIDCSRFPLMALGTEQSGWTEFADYDDQEQLRQYGLESGLIRFARYKKQTKRMFQLWPETQSAIRQVMSERFERLAYWAYKWQDYADASEQEREAKNMKPHGSYWHPLDPVFLTEKQNNSWSGTTERCSAISHEFGKLKKICKFNGSKAGVGISALRQTHRTATEYAGDEKTARLLMGHEDQGIDQRHYIQEKGIEKIQYVCEIARQRLLLANPISSSDWTLKEFKEGVKPPVLDKEK